jgi:NAD(P)-dependent dehydrogenase (short-subunit alcohol dehydrogenase family)
MIRSSILETHLEDWDRLMAVNLRAPFALMKACAKRWIEEMREGRIVNISSGHAVLASRNRAAYAAAKAGLESVTRNAAFEWGKQGVKVFAVAPGFTWTEMSRGSLVGDRLARVESRLPSGKVAEATEVAKVVISYLSGDLDYTAGHTIRFDGGWTNSDVDYSS